LFVFKDQMQEQISAKRGSGHSTKAGKTKMTILLAISVRSTLLFQNDRETDKYNPKASFLQLISGG